MISIGCLIYKSIKYLEFVKRGVEKNTPLLWKGDAEFYFVANNATEKVKEYLKKNNIKHYVFESGPQLPYPQNLPQIYKAWNYAVKVAKGDIVVLMNSDMWPLKGWLEALVEKLNESRVVTSLLVESGKLRSTLPNTIVLNFGRSPDEFRENEFENYARQVSVWNRKTTEYGGTFMPLAIYKNVFEFAGGYPESSTIPGDQAFFSKLKSMGIEHYTAMDSVVYHIQEGEINDKG